MQKISAKLLLLLVIANNFDQSDSEEYEMYDESRRFFIHDASQCGATRKTLTCVPLFKDLLDEETFVFPFQKGDSQIGAYLQDRESGDCLTIVVNLNKKNITIGVGKWRNSSISETCQMKDSHSSELPQSDTAGKKILIGVKHHEIHEVHNLFGLENRWFTVQPTGASVKFDRSVQFDRVCILRVRTYESEIECYPKVRLERRSCVSFAVQPGQQIFPSVTMVRIDNLDAAFNMSIALADARVPSMLSLTHGNSTIDIDIDPLKRVISAREKLPSGEIGEATKLQIEDLNTENIEIFMEYYFFNTNRMQLTVGGQRMKRPLLFPQPEKFRLFSYELRVNVTGGLVMFNHICHGLA